jgi:SAM-dependent methyltransferase
MSAHWRVAGDCLEIASMPFYWRIGEAPAPHAGITPRMPIRVSADVHYDFLRYEPTGSEAATMDAAYRLDANIGFLNPESGQLQTYGSSVNTFLLRTIREVDPAGIVEIGCGAGFSIRFLAQSGYRVTGVDPSDYSRRWAAELGFELVNDFFREGLLDFRPGLIYCNDVFEHVRDVVGFSQTVFDSLDDSGVFCFATTNSERSITLGDISMLEHQHVNMFTESSLHRILRSVGFCDISVQPGGYGNTFHVVARKVAGHAARVEPISRPAACEDFVLRAVRRIARFRQVYESWSNCHCYVPLRCIPYLATVGDFGESRVFDSNRAWRGKYLDGYSRPVESGEDVTWRPGEGFFIGSLTFYAEIREMLLARGVPAEAVFSPEFRL